MSNYVKATNFAVKDTLTSGDPNKLVKGTELNSEFDAIAVAVATKADSANPTFTGTVVVSTGNLNISSGTLTLTNTSVVDGTIDCGTY
jgi:lipopolysaccharide export system protein LptA